MSSSTRTPRAFGSLAVAMVAAVLACIGIGGCASLAGYAAGGTVDHLLQSPGEEATGDAMPVQPGAEVRGTTVDGNRFAGRIVEAERLPDGTARMRIHLGVLGRLPGAAGSVDTVLAVSAVRVDNGKRSPFRYIGLGLGVAVDLLLLPLYILAFSGDKLF